MRTERVKESDRREDTKLALVAHLKGRAASASAAGGRESSH